jgi:hypothetical protein
MLYANITALLAKESNYVHYQRVFSSVLVVRFEVFTAVTMNNAVFWDVMACGSCKNRCFKGKYCLHHQGDKNR